MQLIYFSFILQGYNFVFISESEFLNALEGRAWDKKAKDFAKTEKKRMTNKNRLVLLWQRAGKFKKESKFLKAVNLLNY